MATPIFLLIVVFLGYVLVAFRQTGPEIEEGRPRTTLT